MVIDVKNKNTGFTFEGISSFADCISYDEGVGEVELWRILLD